MIDKKLGQKVEYAPNITESHAQRASRKITNNKVPPQKILGLASCALPLGNYGIVVTEDSVFVPDNPTNMAFTIKFVEIPYKDVAWAKAEKEELHKITTNFTLMFYTNEATVHFKDGREMSFKSAAYYCAYPIVQALNELAQMK